MLLDHDDDIAATQRNTATARRNTTFPIHTPPGFSLPIDVVDQWPNARLAFIIVPQTSLFIPSYTSAACQENRRGLLPFNRAVLIPVRVGLLKGLY